MKVKKLDVFQAREPLQKLLTLPLPAKTAYQIAKLASKLSAEWQLLETVRVGLIKKYGKEVNGSASVDPKDKEQYAKFIAEFTELLAQDTEVVAEVVKLPEMVDGKSLQIEPATLLALEKFVVVE